MNSATKHIVVVAGEESGDLHAAALIESLKAADPKLRISGIGGEHMRRAGAELFSDLAQFGVTGLTEVLKQSKRIYKAYNDLKKHLIKEKPDLLVLVDYPGFNLRAARFTKEKLKIQVLYYISPQIWAWKPKRIKTIKASVDLMAVILPFEKLIYEKAQVPVRFVGHPLVAEIKPGLQAADLRSCLKLPPDTQMIALLPGSRKHELQRHMPILCDTARLLKRRHPNLHFVVPVAPTLDMAQVRAYCSETEAFIHFTSGQAREVMAEANAVIVASGTASLECALLEKPMCIIYKSSPLTYYFAMKWINVRFLGLCNLLAGRMIVPEFLQDDCNPNELARFMDRLISESELQNKMLDHLNAMRQSLAAKQADCSLSELILNWLSTRTFLT